MGGLEELVFFYEDSQKTVNGRKYFDFDIYLI